MDRYRCVWRGYSRARSVRVAFAVLGLTALLGFGAQQAWAADTACPTVITSCGCVIVDASVHTLGNDLDASSGLTSRGDCIDIKHAFATLDGEFLDVDGAGSGVGIRILPGAKRVSVQSFGDIDDWNVGIEDDADGAMITQFHVAGNTTAGLFLKNASRSSASDFFADGNGAGVILKGSNRNTVDGWQAPSACGGVSNGVGAQLIQSNNNSIQAFEVGVDVCSQGNIADGIDLIRSNKNHISSFDADDNGGVGVKLDHSSNNGVVDFFNAENTGDGVFIDPGSNNNQVGSADAELNGANGVEVDSGSKLNNIFNIASSGNAGTDMVDGNANCDKNVWANDCFNTASPSSCIVASPSC